MKSDRELVRAPDAAFHLAHLLLSPGPLSVLREALELPGESAAPARVVLVLLVALRVVLFWLEAGGFFREAGCRTRRAVELAPSGESCYLPRAR